VEKSLSSCRSSFYLWAELLNKEANVTAEDTAADPESDGLVRECLSLNHS